MKKHSSFVTGFSKVAAPAWFYEIHKSMQPLKSTKAFSKKGITDLLKRRGVK